MRQRRNLRVAFGMVICSSLLAACGAQPASEQPEAEEEWPARVETIWTDQHEWFVEHPLLVQGEAAEFAAHLTSLGDFTAVTTGTLEVALLDAQDNVRERVVAESVARPGIFIPEIVPGWSGDGRLSLTYRSPTGEVDEVGWTVRVAASVAELGEGTPDPDGIGFLKEQQWRIPFATVAASRAEVRDTLQLPASIQRHERHAAAVVAPGPGLYRAPSAGLPGPGTAVRAGQVLGSLLPSPGAGGDWAEIQGDLVVASNRLAAAEHDLERASRLVAAGAVPARREIEARTEVDNAAARLESVRARAGVLADLGYQIDGAALLPLRAPLAGVVTELTVTDGERVEAGRPLFHIVDLDRLVARIEVPEPVMVRLLDAVAAGQQVEARVRAAAGVSAVGSEWIPARRLLDFGTEIDPRTRTAPLRYEIVGAGDRLRPGMSAEAILTVGETHEALVIPASAVLDLAGVSVVYVQTGGEAFEERVVRTGDLHGDAIEILSGLLPGDRVVTTGAYQVRLAALSPDAAPAHSH